MSTEYPVPLLALGPHSNSSGRELTPMFWMEPLDLWRLSMCSHHRKLRPGLLAGVSGWVRCPLSPTSRMVGPKPEPDTFLPFSLTHAQPPSSAAQFAARILKPPPLPLRTQYFLTPNSQSRDQSLGGLKAPTPAPNTSAQSQESWSASSLSFPLGEIQEPLMPQQFYLAPCTWVRGSFS